MVGAGIGGLALAQGLVRRGLDVVVLERDTDLAHTGGYRLHLGTSAVDSLARELPPMVWQSLRAASAGPESFTAMHLADRQLRLLGRVKPEGGRHMLVGRRPLRVTLATGLDAHVRLGEEATGFVREGSSVRVLARSGTEVACDLMVAADGVGSAIASQAAGRPTSAPIGLVGLAGRHLDVAAIDRKAPPYLTAGPALAFGPRGVGLFLSRHDPATADVDPGAGPAHIEEPSWIWGLILTRAASERRLPDLVEAAARTRGWAPWARHLMSTTPPDQIGTYRFHASDPTAPTFGWPASNVTALGDAVHAMPPTGGQSAATAIEDAADLLGVVDRVTSGAVTLPVALADYHHVVDRRARPRIRESLGPATWVARTSGPAAGMALTAATNLIHGYRTLTRSTT
ncbi:NAD(P)/FAD-dependent oxidoreductase [Nocardioides hwasunensis]